MKRIAQILILVAFVSIAQSNHALDIASEKAGSLDRLISDLTITDLKISGPINAADLYFVGDKCGALTYLDLSDAVIDAYSGEIVHLHDQYPAGTIPPMVFSGVALQQVKLPVSQRLTIDDGAFAGTQITAIDLAQVDSIGYGAFANCQALTQVLIPCKSVGAHAFSGCTSMVNADITALDKLPEGIFAQCSSLNALSGSENITAIGDRAFAGCTSLENYAFGSGLNVLGNSAFELSGLTAADLSKASALGKIGDRAFASCYKLAQVKFPEGLNDLGEGSFFEDRSLSEIALPSGLDALPDRVFKGAEGISGKLILPDKISYIGRFALKDLSAVEEVDLPNGLTELGDFAMENMSGLKNINANGLTLVPIPGIDVWRGVKQEDVVVRVDKEYADAFKSADQWEKFTFDFETGVEDLTADNSVKLVGHFEGTDLMVFATGAEIAELSLYDLSGRLLVAVKPSQQAVVIDTANFAGNIFVVSAKLADNRRATLKLGRK